MQQSGSQGCDICTTDLEKMRICPDTSGIVEWSLHYSLSSEWLYTPKCVERPLVCRLCKLVIALKTASRRHSSPRPLSLQSLAKCPLRSPGYQIRCKQHE